MFFFNVTYLEEKNLSKLQPQTFKEVLSTLGYLVQYNWQQISTNKIKRFHEVPLDSIKEKIANHHRKAEQKELGTNSKKLISFAFNRQGRLLGFRKDNEFMITYVDSTHDYC